MNDAEGIETRDETCVLGGRTLGVVEVGEGGDDGVLDGGVEVGFCDLFSLRRTSHEISSRD